MLLIQNNQRENKINCLTKKVTETEMKTLIDLGIRGKSEKRSLK